jgi:regulation of enolase protein 1 (concanavalin A-like superfamily)
MYIIINNFFDEQIIIKTELELVNLLNHMPTTGDYDWYLFNFADESRPFPQISVYARGRMCVIQYLAMENNSMTMRVAYNPFVEETSETVWFFTNPEGNEVRFPASWIKSFTELKECIMTFFKVKDRPPECLEWKFVGQTEGGNTA